MSERYFGFIAAILLAHCGGGAKVTIDLVTPEEATLDPFRGAETLRNVRVTIDGPDPHDDAILDLSPSDRSGTFEGYPTGREVSVRAEGFDELGTLVSFGRAERIEITGDAAVPVPFRRNLAYVTHRPNPRQRQPSGALYVLDIASRTYVTTVRIPGTAPIGRGVSARGGEGMLVAYEDGASGFVGFLSGQTHAWTSIPLARPQDLALSVPGKSIGVAAGGGAITLFDFDRRTVVKEFTAGGTVLDGAMSADGQRAVIIVDVTPGLIIVDLTDTCLKELNQVKCLRALDVIRAPSGVALAGDGRIAYVTSSEERSVVAIDLQNLQTTVLNRSGFAVPVRAAAYSDAIQGVLAIQQGENGPAPRVLAFVVPGQQGFSLSDGVPTLLEPSDIAADPGGRRLVVVSSGTSTASAGLTVIETAFDAREEAVGPPVGSTGLYPTDPEDAYMEGEFRAYQRYQPFRVGIPFGR